MAYFLELDDFFRRLWAPPADPFSEVRALAGEEFRRVKTRRTFRVEIAGRGYFVKHHLGVGWGEIFKNLLSGKLPVLGALDEYRALLELKRLGVPTMTPGACGCRGWDPAHLESFLVTEELAGMVDLETLCSNWRTSPPPSQLRHVLIRAVAESAGKMHRGGINHRDCYICHYLTPREGADFGKRVYVIDLHRAQLRKRVPRRYLVKDLAGLCFSAFDAGLTRRDALRFIRSYSGRKLRAEFSENAALWRSVLRCAGKLYFKEFHRPAPELEPPLRSPSD